MTISISDICKQWSCSRTTVMKGIAEKAWDKQLIGEKDKRGRWTFEVDNVIRWRGNPKTSSTPSAEEQVQQAVEKPVPDTTQDAVIKAKDEMIAMLSNQIEIKDRQLEQVQKTLQDQTMLLEDHRATLSAFRSKGFFGKLFS